MPSLFLIDPAQAHNSYLPTSIAGCQVWLDPNDNTTITQSLTKCSQINDKSGNGVNFTQATSTKQPVITPAAINGKQAFTSVQASLVGMNGTLPSILSDCTVVAVVKSTANAAGNGIFSNYQFSGDITLEIDLTNANAVSVYLTSVGRTAASAANTFNTGTVYCVAMTYNSSGTGTIKMFLNNSNVSSASQGSSGRHMHTSVGWPTNAAWNQSFDGLLGDLIVYNSDIGTTNLTALYSNYLKPKWGLP